MQEAVKMQESVHITQSIPMGPLTTRVNCPSCQASISTRVEHEASAKTHIVALIMCFTLCLCCVPYCVNSCQNANHYCPKCGAFLGTYK